MTKNIVVHHCVYRGMDLQDDTVGSFHPVHRVPQRHRLLSLLQDQRVLSQLYSLEVRPALLLHALQVLLLPLHVLPGQYVRIAG